MQPFILLYDDMMRNTTSDHPVEDRTTEQLTTEKLSMINQYHNQIIQLINLKYEHRVNR